MSRSFRSTDAGQPPDPLSWTRFEWRTGADAYSFAITGQGMFGTLSAPGGREITLPVVAWEGLFNAVKINGKAKIVADRNLPARSGARWTEPESAEIECKFKLGAGIEELARSHARTVWAVETQLAKAGLWDRIERKPLIGGPPIGPQIEGPQIQQLAMTMPPDNRSPRAETAPARGDDHDWRKEFEPALQSVSAAVKRTTPSLPPPPCGEGIGVGGLE